MSYALSDISYNDGSAKVIRNIIGGDWNPEATLLLGKNSSAVDPGAFFGGKVTPKAGFRTSDLAAILAMSPLAGVKVTGGITLPFRKRDDCGDFTSGSTHASSTCTAGLLLVEELTVSGESEGEETPAAVAQCAFHAKSANGTDPIGVSTNVSLSAESFGSQFTLGPVYVNGTLVPQVTNYSLRMNHRVMVRHYNGLNFPQKVFIVFRSPQIQLELDDLAAFKTAGGFGASFSAVTNVIAYLRKRKSASDFEDPAATVHGSISFGAGLAKTDNISFSQGQNGTGRVSINAANLSWSVGVALP